MEALPYIIVLIFTSLFFCIAIKTAELKFSSINLVHEYKYSYFSYFFLLIAYIALVIFSSYRIIEPSLGGIDALGYKNYFLGATGSLAESLEYQNYETGYAFFVWGIRQITNNYNMLLLIVYSCMFLILAMFLKYITWNVHTIWTVLLLIILFFNSFNTLRVIIGIFLGMYSIILGYKQKTFKKWIVILLAISIHISALILIPMHFTNFIISKREKFKWKKLIQVVGMLFIASTLSVGLVVLIARNTRYYVYLSSESDVAIGSYIMILITSILSIYKYDEVININPFNKVLINVLPVGLIVIPLQLQFSILYRMVLYFMPIMYALIPALIKAYRVTSLKKVHYYFVKLGLLLYLFTRIYIFFTVEIYSSGVPYLNYFV